MYKFNLDILESNQNLVLELFVCKAKMCGTPCTIKVAENLESFERLKKFWSGKTCSCSVCQIYSKESFS